MQDDADDRERREPTGVQWSVLCFAAVYGHLAALVVLFAVGFGVHSHQAFGVSSNPAADAAYADWATSVLLERFGLAAWIVFTSAFATTMAGYRTAPHARLAHGLLAIPFTFAIAWLLLQTWTSA